MMEAAHQKRRFTPSRLHSDISQMDLVFLQILVGKVVEDNIKVNLKETIKRVWTEFIWVRYRSVVVYSKVP
jgi:hypothetical protein